MLGSLTGSDFNRFGQVLKRLQKEKKNVYKIKDLSL